MKNLRLYFSGSLSGKQWDPWKHSITFEFRVVTDNDCSISKKKIDLDARVHTHTHTARDQRTSRDSPISSGRQPLCSEGHHAAQVEHSQEVIIETAQPAHGRVLLCVYMCVRKRETVNFVCVCERETGTEREKESDYMCVSGCVFVCKCP